MINLNKESIKNKIAEANLEEAIQDLIALLKPWNNPLYNEVIILKRQYIDVKRSENLRLENFTEISIEKNKITNSLLAIIDSIDKSIFNTSHFAIINGISEDFFLANYDSIINKLQNSVEQFDLKDSIYSIIGQCYFYKGDFYKAKYFFSKSIQLNPENLYSFYYRSIACSYLGEAGQYVSDADNALKICSNNIEKDINITDSNYYMGLLLFEKLKTSEAESFFMTAIERLNAIIASEENNLLAIFKRGLCYAKTFQYEKSIRDLNKCVIESPANAFFCAEFANVYNSYSENEKAIRFAGYATELCPSNPYYHSIRAWCYHEKNDQVRARTCVESAIDINPEDPFYYVIKGITYHEEDKDLSLFYFNKALKLAQDFLGVHSDFGTYSISKVIASYYKGDYHAALIDLNRLIFHNNKHDIFLNIRVAIYAKLEEWEKVLEDASLILNINPNNSDAHLYIGNYYFYKNDYQTSIKSYEKSIELNPYNPISYENKINALVESGDFNNAVMDINKLIKRFPDNDKYYFLRSSLFRTMGNNTSALTDLQKCLEINPLNSDALSSLALVYLGDQDIPKALETINKAIEYNPTNIELPVLRTVIYQHKGEYTKAIKEFTDYINQNIQVVESYYSRGLCYFSLQEFELAKRDFIQVFNLNPDDSANITYLGLCFTRLDDNEGAIKLYSNALDKITDNPTIFLNRGCAYARLGKYKKAIKDLDKAIELDPGEASKYWQRGEIFFVMDEKIDDAFKDFNKAIKINPNNGKFYLSRGRLHLRLNENNKDLARADFKKAIELGEDEARSDLDATYTFWEKIFGS